MKYTCMIVDDEPLSHQVLENHMERMGNLEKKASAFNAVDARKMLEEDPVQILFLDIQMPEITGLELLQSLPAPPVTVFTTAYRRFAMDGFNLGVADYLLKPVSFERFQKAVKRALLVLNNQHGEAQIEVRSGNKTHLIKIIEIDYAQGMKDYTILHVQGKKYVAKGSLKNYEERLPLTHFIRVHKSYIVARRSMKLLRQQKIILETVEIPIGRMFKRSVENYLAGLKIHS